MNDKNIKTDEKAEAKSENILPKTGDVELEYFAQVQLLLNDEAIVTRAGNTYVVPKSIADKHIAAGLAKKTV